MPAFVRDIFRLSFNLLLIFICYVAGIWLSPALPFVVPAPLIGMLLLLVLLALRGQVSSSMGRVSRPLLNHMALFFVPLVVGVWQFRDVFIQHWVAMALVIVMSTIVSFVLVALLAKYCVKEQ